MANPNCPKCKGKGRIIEPDGTVHTCWDCLEKGHLDQHSKDLKDTNIIV
jgi:DnaJ-class molecular chaperone